MTEAITSQTQEASLLAGAAIPITT